VRRTSFYPGGPERGRQDVTPAEEVAECRRILGDLASPATIAEIEAYPDALTLGAERDRELWGDDPFGED
jgi:hypothetical protein